MGNRRVALLISEFVPLNRRRVRGDPALSVPELEHWSELRDHLAHEFGHATEGGPVRQPRQLRVPTHLKVRYGGDSERSGALENLSEGGLFVRCSEPLAKGAPLHLEIEGEHGDPPLHLEAVVVHCRELDNQDRPTGFGVEFRNLEVADCFALTKLIEDALSSALED